MRKICTAYSASILHRLEVINLKSWRCENKQNIQHIFPYVGRHLGGGLLPYAYIFRKLSSSSR